MKFDHNVSLKQLMWLKIIFFQFCNWSSSVYVSVFAKLYCISNYLFIFIYGSIKMSHFNQYSASIRLNYITSIVELNVDTLFSLIHGEEYVRRFVKMLEKDFPGLQKFYKYYVTIYLSLIGLVGFLIFFTMDIRGGDNILKPCLFFNRSVACYFCRISVIYVIEGYRNTVSILRKQLNTQLNMNNITEAQKTVFIKEFTHSFIKLTEHFDSAMTIIRPLTIFRFVIDFCKILNIIYYISFFDISSFVISWTFEVIIEMLSLCCPMLILESAADDLDEIRKIIAKELLTYEDYYLRSVIYESMEFVDGYTTGLNVWNQYPMNKDMVLAFIGLITSYVIALLQFSY
ncbi:hypothetical protein B5X24_HaOG200846 [Helicoverpa armigera]|uniref:Gustatory receptor n=1 Tax=Helicoverpa armigera TaxID=29058 RepID=A0A2W1BIL7_HELAM|nr:hypothetical protein B5X24_HaOG200846 [Helicoverpa armigera]